MICFGSHFGYTDSTKSKAPVQIESCKPLSTPLVFVMPRSAPGAGQKSIKDHYRHLYQWSTNNKRSFAMEEFPDLLKSAPGIDITAIYNKWQQPIER